MTRPLIHPRMLERLGAFYPSLCTIEALPDPAASSVAVDDEHGGQRPQWAPVEGLTDIPCCKAPFSAAAPTSARDRRAPKLTAARNEFTIALQGYYPAITAAMRAVVDDVAHNILGDAESDSQGKLTRLHVEIVKI